MLQPMNGQILILTDKCDVHPTSVINLMKERNVPFFRLNTENLMIDYDFAWFHESGHMPDFYIKDRNNGKTIWGHEVWSVWYRKPGAPESVPYTVNEDVDRHNMTEARQFFIYLMHYLSDTYSLGNHLWDKRANSKMVQSKIAVELGMRIAPTCISNTKNDIIGFAGKYEDVSLKSLRNHWVLTEKDEVYNLRTIKVKPQQLKEQPVESFRQSVIFAQQYIEKKYELRVTVIGKFIFTCKLDSQAQTSTTGAVDWRDGYDYGLKHEIIETPAEIDKFCRKYLSRLNLNFGCFDFIVTPDDSFVFLECNPNGQWGWIEDLCHVPMSEAVVDSLVNKFPVIDEHA